MQLDPQQTLCLIVDIQEKLVTAMAESERLIRQTSRLITGCRLLDIPFIVTEQYPAGLGHTHAVLNQLLPESTLRFEKTAFAATAVPEVNCALKEHGRQQILVAGVETHICVNQTVIGLLEADYHPYLIANAIASRTDEAYHIGLEKMMQVGAVLSNVEMALFELLGDSKHAQFKAVQELIK